VFLFLCRLFCLTVQTISITRDPVKHKLTKHIGVDVYFT
jgi:hypothetical protein